MAKTKSNKLGIEGIGRLETEIMGVIWDYDREVTVREVYEVMRDRRKGSIAYTTCMTVMNNLANKKKKAVPLLEQDKAATAYVYKATKTDVTVAEELVATIMEKVLRNKRKTLTINA